LKLLPRHASEQVLQHLREARIVVLNGPRQAGKTTTILQLAKRTGGTYLSLDDREQRAACLTDPQTFLDKPRPVIVDEFQLGGDDLLRAAKLLVDQRPEPGQFLFTGSTRFLTVPTISESLAGRVRIVDLWPFTQGEIGELGQEADSLLPRLMAPGPLVGTVVDKLPTRAEYFERICKGGYPEAQALDSTGRRHFFDDYVRTVTQRDVPEISKVRHVTELRRILEFLAATTAQEINDTRLAEKLNLDRRTLRLNYLPLLHTGDLATETPAWSRSPVARVIKRPKSYLTDTGVAAHLLRFDPERLAEPTSPATGPLVETFVVNELLRQVSRFGAETGANLYHYRATTGAEVDVVIETPDGRVAFIEVKAGAWVRRRDFTALVALRDRIDSLDDQQFVRGVVMHLGTEAQSFGDRLEALPLASLWLPPPGGRQSEASARRALARGHGA
jgi:uncharacterized protein